MVWESEWGLSGLKEQDLFAVDGYSYLQKHGYCGESFFGEGSLNCRFGKKAGLYSNECV